MSSPVVLVTGASRGIGRCIAQRLAAKGATIAVNYRSDDSAADATLASLQGTGHLLFKADIGSPAACESLVAAVLERFGRIDALVNNAGVLERIDVNQCASYEAFVEGNRRHLDANATSASNLMFLVCKAVASQAPRSPGASVEGSIQPTPADCKCRIVNISSRSAYQASAVAVTTYAASKAAMSLMSQNLARTFGRCGIGFYTVAPTFVLTDMVAGHWDSVKEAVLAQHPSGRIPTGDEIARAVEWLALEAPLAATGSIVDVNCASHIHH